MTLRAHALSTRGTFPRVCSRPGGHSGAFACVTEDALGDVAHAQRCHQVRVCFLAPSPVPKGRRVCIRVTRASLPQEKQRRSPRGKRNVRSSVAGSGGDSAFPRLPGKYGPFRPPSPPSRLSSGEAKLRGAGSCLPRAALFC